MKKNNNIAFESITNFNSDDNKNDKQIKKIEKGQIENVKTNSFANGLPEWDLVPPQMIVRRKRKYD